MATNNRWTRRGPAAGLCSLLFFSAASAQPDRPRFGDVAHVGVGHTTLILVPCLGCDGRAWDQFMARNADRYSMMAVTWPGMGATALPEVSDAPDELPLWSYALEAMTTLLLEEQLEDVVLVGHSAGAAYAVMYGHANPERVRAVVNVDATITNGDTFGFDRRQRLEWAAAEFREVLEQYDSDAAWATLNSPPRLPDAARSAFYGRMWMQPPRSHVLAYWREWLAADCGVLIRDYPVPLLSLFGIRAADDNPALTRRERLARYARAQAPPSVVVDFIENAGHSIWEWQPEAFDRALATFLESLER